MSSPALGLRERKRLRLREDLADAALRLYAEKGFEATTVEDVVDAVQVSKRTFFRTYPSKEAVALDAEQQLLDGYTAQIYASPMQGTLLTFYREALSATLDRMDPSWDARCARCRHLVQTTPALTAQSLQKCSATTRRVVEILQTRLGEDAPAAAWLQLPFEAGLAAWRLALDTWIAAGEAPDRRALQTRVEDVFAAVTPSFSYTLSDTGRGSDRS